MTYFNLNIFSALSQKISPETLFLISLMMYVGGLFVDLAKTSKISSVNGGLYPFWNKISFFEVLTLSTILNFGLAYFMNNLLYKIDRKSLFSTSLGDFPIDRFLRQFNVETNCCNLRGNFLPCSSL